MSSASNDKKEKEDTQKVEESKNNEEQTEMKLEEPSNPEQSSPKEEANPPKATTIEEPEKVNQIEESKVNDVKPEIPKKITKRDPPLKITDEILKRRIEFAKKISPLTYMTKNQKKKEIKMTEEEKEKIHANSFFRYCQTH